MANIPGMDSTSLKTAMVRPVSLLSSTLTGQFFFRMSDKFMVSDVFCDFYLLFFINLV